MIAFAYWSLLAFAVGFFASLGFMCGVFCGMSLAELWDYGDDRNQA